jgi:peptidoglycan/LPS O-acetylase OafA/YrhL
VTQNNNSHRDDIDGLRALAVLLVVAYHAAPTVVPGGFVGVDIFFVISGYLITGNILKDLDRQRFSFLEFYARRCRRIIPALAIVLFGVWLLAWYALLPEEFRTLGKHIVGGATFTTNFLLWRESGYFDAAAATKPLLHLWSLAIEEQFYILWPAILVLAFRYRAAQAVTVVLLVGSFVLNVSGAQSVAATFYLLPPRFWELLLGAALIQVERRSLLTFVRARANVVAWCAAGLIVAGAALLDGHRLYPGWWGLLPTVGALLLIVVGPSAWLNRAPLSATPVVLIGLISYPLYLWHWPLLSLARIVESGQPSGGVKLLAVGLAAVFAWLTWRLAERPIRSRLFVFRGSRGLMRSCIAVTTASLILALALGGASTAGYVPSAPRAAAFEDLAGSRAIDRPSSPCSGAFEPGKMLTWCASSGVRPPEIAVFGDSHAYYLSTGLSEVYEKRGGSLLLIGATGCPPVTHVGGFPATCVNANEMALKLLTASPTIATVVLASLGPYYMTGKPFGTAKNRLDSFEGVLEPVDIGRPEDREANFARGFDATISALERAGKHVVLFIDIPELDFIPEGCLDGRPVRITRSHLQSPCGVPRRNVDERQAIYRAIIARLHHAHPSARVFDPVVYMCDKELCNAELDGRLLYRDTHHLSTYGSRFIGRQFEKWLQPVRESFQ